MRRRPKAPTTQLARAGQRTYILTNDAGLSQIRFRATVLDGAPAGRIEIETGEGLPRTQPLTSENMVDTTGMTRLALVPERDTAVTFLPIDRPASGWAFAGGLVLVAVAIGWTIWDFLGG